MSGAVEAADVEVKPTGWEAWVRALRPQSQWRCVAGLGGTGTSQEGLLVQRCQWGLGGGGGCGGWWRREQLLGGGPGGSASLPGLVPAAGEEGRHQGKQCSGFGV